MASGNRGETAMVRFAYKNRCRPRDLVVNANGCRAACILLLILFRNFLRHYHLFLIFFPAGAFNSLSISVFISLLRKTPKSHSRGFACNEQTPHLRAGYYLFAKHVKKNLITEPRIYSWLDLTLKCPLD